MPRSGQVDFSKLSALDQIAVDDNAEREELMSLAADARAFLMTHRWCEAVVEIYVGMFLPGILAVFLSRIEPAEPEVDSMLWVIVGDLPPAYITCDNAPNAAAALDGYVGAMVEWVSAVESGDPVDGLIPVNVEPSRKYAAMLGSRLAFIDDKILPEYAQELQSSSNRMELRAGIQ